MQIIKVPSIPSLKVTAEREQSHLLLTSMISHSDIYIRFPLQSRYIEGKKVLLGLLWGTTAINISSRCGV